MESSYSVNRAPATSSSQYNLSSNRGHINQQGPMSVGSPSFYGSNGQMQWNQPQIFSSISKPPSMPQLSNSNPGMPPNINSLQRVPSVPLFSATKGSQQNLQTIEGGKVDVQGIVNQWDMYAPMMADWAEQARYGAPRMSPNGPSTLTDPNGQPRKIDPRFGRLVEEISRAPGYLNELDNYAERRKTRMSERNVDATLILDNDRNALCLPAFLEMEYGKDYRLLNQFSKGGGGELFKAQILNFGKLPRNVVVDLNDIVAKVVKRPDESKGPAALKKAVAIFEQEVSIMYALLPHPNVIKLVGYTNKPDMVILSKRYEMDLKSLILDKTVNPFPFWSLTKDVISGFSALHNLQISHRDIKSSNILVERIEDPVNPGRQLWRAVIADFGLSYVFGDEDVMTREKVFTFGFSYPYASPEILFQKINKEKNSNTTIEECQKIDVYAFGCMIWEMLERVMIWKGFKASEIEERVCKGDRPGFSDANQNHPAVPLIEASWAQDPLQRPTFAELEEDVLQITATVFRNNINKMLPPKP